jgi:error-prone DNA polymerase
MKTVYAELLCRSNFSFQQGASHAEELIDTASKFGYRAIAITDECSLAGSARAHIRWRKLMAAQSVQSDTVRKHHFRVIVGASFKWQDNELVLLAQTRQGYGDLCELITRCRRHITKGTYRLNPRELASVRDCYAIILPGNDPHPLLDNTVLLGRSIGYTRKLASTDAIRFQRALEIAHEYGLQVTACGDIVSHDKSRQSLQDILTAVKHKTTVDQLGSLAEQNAERTLRPLSALRLLYPAELLVQSSLIAQTCKFTLEELRYEYPHEVVPPGHTKTSYLREQTWQGALKRYHGKIPPSVVELLEKEFALVIEKEYEAFFLTVYDIVNEARRLGILCQGRGSSANSVICYCLHITELDPERSHLLFERFVSKERNEPPDIDVDFEHERREEIIQYIFKKYGRNRAALCATVICYRTKGAIRDVGKALGFSEDQVDRISKNLSWWDKKSDLDKRLIEMGFDPATPRVQQLIYYTEQLRGFPRHLSQHPGGFVIAQERLDRQVPIEDAAMPDRTVIQWDKDDIDELGRSNSRR